MNQLIYEIFPALAGNGTGIAPAPNAPVSFGSSAASQTAAANVYYALLLGRD